MLVEKLFLNEMNALFTRIFDVFRAFYFFPTEKLGKINKIRQHYKEE